MFLEVFYMKSGDVEAILSRLDSEMYLVDLDNLHVKLIELLCKVGNRVAVGYPENSLIDRVEKYAIPDYEDIRRIENVRC